MQQGGRLQVSMLPAPARATGLRTVAETCEQPIWSQASGVAEVSPEHDVHIGVGRLHVAQYRWPETVQQFQYCLYCRPQHFSITLG